MKKRKIRQGNSGSNQVLGLFLMGISAFMFLAIISYNLDDPVNINVDDNPLQTHNWLGPLGAWFAHYIIQCTFGYAAIVFPAILRVRGPGCKPWLSPARADATNSTFSCRHSGAMRAQRCLPFQEPAR